MKTFIAILGGALLATSCAYRGALYPLQPGEKIIFATGARAVEYRQRSGNDAGQTNRVVEITRPCAITCE
ncbi:MAG TPA: hypothetical protein P5169_03490 [Kiritimatiellia bacterium]|jgi:hypothetical protein|nr:hypothetical protein [Kiritimatiellia bacterium]